MRYLTDGVDLLEVVAIHEEVNFGLARGVIRRTLVRGARDDSPIWALSDFQLLFYREVATPPSRP